MLLTPALKREAAARDWTRRLLRTDAEELPDDDITPFVKSSIRSLRMMLSWLDLDSLSAEDIEAFGEGAGYVTAARWLMLPRPDGEEQVTKTKIGQLEEQYKVPDIDALVERFLREGARAISTIEAVAAYQLERFQAGAGKPKFTTGSRLRREAAENPNQAGVLAMLFASRDTLLFGDAFGDPTTGPQ